MRCYYLDIDNNNIKKEDIMYLSSIKSIETCYTDHTTDWKSFIDLCKVNERRDKRAQ